MRNALLASFLLTLLAAPAWAQSVALQGMLGNRALLIVDGSAPKSVAPGDSHKGVKVVSTAGDQAVVEFGGRRQTLRVGEAPASVGSTGAAPSGDRIVLTAGSGGHFHTVGQINGKTAAFLVDTGATKVSMGQAEADRLGVDYKSGTRGLAETANGRVPVYAVMLNSVRVGDVQVANVEALVLPSSMPHILLGNSFLTRFQMKRENEVMRLEKRPN